MGRDDKENYSKNGRAKPYCSAKRGKAHGKYAHAQKNKERNKKNEQHDFHKHSDIG